MDEVPALAIEGLQVSYGQKDILRGLDLHIARGEIFGLLGPNGAGKTTLIRTICGRIKWRAGQVLIAGLPVSKRSLRGVGIVPQEIALYPYMSARENLEVFGQLSGLTRRQTGAAMDWAVAAAGLGPKLDDRVEILSGGWKRRVNIAAAILHQPELLILDEPTVGVDADARQGLHDIMLELSRQGMGVLLTTHDLDQAETVCSRVGFLQNGRIAPQGAPRQLVQDAFRGEMEILIELRHEAEPRQADALRRMGFQPSNGGLTWGRLGLISGISQEVLTRALEDAGLALRETRFREPGLDTLFLRLSRQRDDVVVPEDAA